MTEQKKTLAEIAQQRAEYAQELKAKIEESENARREWEKLDSASKRAYLLNTPAEERIMRKWAAIEKDIARLKNIAHILRHNYRVALAAQVLPAFLEILKKYDGKKAGEKTREKIVEEMRTACGCSLWFERNYNSQKSESAHICEIIGGAWNGEKIDIYTVNRAAIIAEENTINGKLTAEALRANIGEYIEDPAAHLEEIEKARATVEEIKKQYNDAAAKYNSLIVQGFEKVEKIYK